jgi:hypothetical protein
MAPRSKSLDSDLRSNYEDSDNEECAVAPRESECDFICENATQCNFQCENVPHCQMQNCDLTKSDVVCCEGSDEQMLAKKKIKTKKTEDYQYQTEDDSKR